jgi:hypothetical protein
VAALSTEPIARPAQASTSSDAARCTACGAPLAADQRYCLECGERGTRMSSVLADGPPGSQAAAQPPSAPPGPPGAASGDSGRNGALAIIAGVGVLLLAMGVGVLIGRAGSGSGHAPAAQVITVGGSGAAGSGSSQSSEASFSGDWPSGTSGFTVQLQTLPTSGTTVVAVASAKSAATAKGAKSVGALRSSDYSSLPSGNYVIYSGVYHTRAEAQKALTALHKSFPGATVISVSNGAGSGGSGAAGGAAKGSGSDIQHPAPPTVLENLKHAKGKSYEERSKNLPDVVSTG